MKRFVPLFALAMLAGPFAWAGHGGHGGDRHFDKMDTNGDGLISAAEHAAGATAKFAKMDLDGSGTTDADEIVAAHEQMRKDREAEMAAEKVRKLDANGDGVVSSAEFGGAMQARFANADADKDGNLSKDEMKAAHRSKMDLHRMDKAEPAR